MTRKAIRLGADLALPAEEFIESATAILGKRRSGKSGAVKVIAEEAVRLGLPFVILDPVGIHWGLRSSFDGKKPGLPVLVIGGKHGDLDLSPEKGADIARGIIEANVSAVIDFKESSKAAFRRFAKDFADELYAKNDSPRLVIFEEAPELLPQTIRPDQAATFDAMERLVRLGRNQGIGVVLVGQRPAKINKDALTQIDNLLIGRILSPQDRKAVKEWVEAWDVEDRLPEFEKGLAALPTQTLWLWSPEALKEFRPVRIRNFTTLHADKTHLRRLGLLAAKPVTTDVSAVVAKLGPMLKAAAETKTAGGPETIALRARTKALEAEIDRLRKAAPKPSTVDADRLREEALATARKEYRTILATVARQQARLVRASGEIAEALKAMPDLVASQVPVLVEPRVPPVIHRPVPAPRSVRPGPAGDEQAAPENGDGHLYSGALKILTELARRHPLGLTYGQAATLTGFAPKGHTFRTYYGILRRQGLVEMDGAKGLRATQAGLDRVRADLGDVPPSPSTHEEIVAMWKSKLYSGAGATLDVLIRSHPHPVAVEEIAEATGFAAVGHTIRTYLGILTRNGLAEKVDGSYRASTSLWP